MAFWLPPGAQSLAVTITSPGLVTPISISVPYPAPVLLPWTPGYYPPAWSLGQGSGPDLDLDVQQLDPPNGTTYRVRCWSAGVLMVDHTFTASEPFPPGMPGLIQRSQGGATHFLDIQITDVPFPCSLLLDVYEDDRETIAWSVSTDPSHPHQYLCDPENYGEQEIDPVSGGATIGQAQVVLIDKAQTPGDQDSGWLTERLQDIAGRRCKLRRFTGEINPPYVTIVDGPADSPDMEDFPTFRVLVNDTREHERQLRAFHVNSTTTLWPAGVIGGFGWNAETDTWLVPPTEPVTGHWYPVLRGRAAPLRRTPILHALERAAG